ncbi:4-alpha-glucanotransferase [Thalassotalea sp. PLHSN55]|uniref:4-alpha-glucanotransferase n=1 Tax=Thalassotalea sp. PLHSN55 TaxID=3435888 RepID=UPI003F86A25D
MDEKSKLCYLQGIGLEYVDYQGKQQIIAQEIRDQLLIACGHQLETNSVNQAIEDLDALPWLDVLPNIQAVNEDSCSIKLRFAPHLIKQSFTWKILNQAQQVIDQGQALANTLDESGHYFYQQQRFSERLLKLEHLPANYYQLEVELLNSTYTGELICRPAQCYNPIKDDKVWGVSVQLYSVKSTDNFGIGDFNDLKMLISMSAKAGADYILLNPLHKLFQHSPERASPYSPSDRTQLNPLYISPRLSEDFEEVDVSINTDEPFIDYQAVSTEKHAIYIQMYKSFCTHHLEHNTARAQQFSSFKAKHHAWQLTNFNYYLQWQAHQQLEYCQQFCLQLKMKIGLMLDLAVGCSPDGEEYDRNQALFANKVSIGAPPDPIALDGQNWGLPAPNPTQLKLHQYKPFISLLRANMKHCGALRIDHVMGLLRLWWCIQYQEQQHGCYVYYPFEDLVAILVLESQLNSCLIVGEDLGIVPPEVITSMAKNHIFGNDIFYFEKNTDGKFKQPQEYRQNALLMIANHDVPPFFAWWQTDDLQIKNNYQLFSQPQQYSEALAQREQDKQHLIQWLGNGDITDTSQSIYQAVAIKLATAASTLFCLQIEDLEGNTTPVNIPGTDKEYPNWSRRLNQPLSKTFAQTKLFDSINLGRLHAKEQSSNHNLAT